MRTKLWEHRTALIGEPSLHLSDEQSWLGDSVLNVGLVDLADLVWPLTCVLNQGMTVNLLKVWDASRIQYRRIKAEHHRLAGELVFRPAKKTLIQRASKVIRQAIGETESEDIYPAILFANPLVPKGFNANSAGILNQVIPHARVLAGLTQGKQIAQDLQTFNEVAIRQGRLDEILPLGFALLCLGDRSLSSMAPEAYHYFNALPITPISVLSRNEAPQPASVVDVDGSITAWIEKANYGSVDEGVIAMIAPDRSCAAVFTPHEATEQIGLFCKIYGLEMPHFVDAIPQTAPLPPTDLDVIAERMGEARLRNKARNYVKNVLASRTSGQARSGRGPAGDA